MANTIEDLKKAKEMAYEWMSRFNLDDKTIREELKIHLNEDFRWAVENTERLAGQAQKSEIIWEVACEYIATKIESKEIIEKHLIPIATEALRNPKSAKPRKRGRDPLVNAYRDLLFVTTIKLMKERWNISPSRNPETTTRESACDITNEVAKELGMSSTFETVESVWKKFSYKDRLSEIIADSVRYNHMIFIIFIKTVHLEGGTYPESY